MFSNFATRSGTAYSALDSTGPVLARALFEFSKLGEGEEDALRITLEIVEGADDGDERSILLS